MAEGGRQGEERSEELGGSMKLQNGSTAKRLLFLSTVQPFDGGSWLPGVAPHLRSSKHFFTHFVTKFDEEEEAKSVLQTTNMQLKSEF
ncbi:hypothetical protein BBJ28_00012333 [Nothophytophthora sp. Chile5]|nr:hypothetical protein BBJ28_00012333 [Nothophytophthora sp. Chile5]